MEGKEYERQQLEDKEEVEKRWFKEKQELKKVLKEQKTLEWSLKKSDWKGKRTRKKEMKVDAGRVL